MNDSTEIKPIERELMDKATALVQEHKYAAIGGGLGAALGAAVGGPVGAAVGGCIGGLIGGLMEKNDDCQSD